MKFKSLVMWIVSALLLVSCQTETETETTTFTGFSVDVANAITISAQLNDKGEISVSGVVSTPTSLGFVTWDVGFETVLNKAKTQQYTLFILYKDEGGQIIQNEYAINQPFKINFSKEQWVKDIDSDGNGNLIVSVELRVAQSGSTQPFVQAPTKESLPVPGPAATLDPVTPNSESCTEVTVTMTDTPMGEVLHIQQCSNWSYDTTPLSKGVYALSPEKKYVIYCTNAGDIYMIKVGNSDLVFIENLKVKMSAFQIEDVLLKITFSQDDLHHYALIHDQISGQEETVKIPPYMYK